MRFGSNQEHILRKLKNFKTKLYKSCFKVKLEPAKLLFRDLKIIRISDLLAFNNCQFVQHHMIENLPH